ncbi:proteasome regulatory particle base subunit rpn10 [Binucleata daphniae]
MAEVAMVILDNSYNQQNQDYLPNRLLLQKDTIRCLINEFIDESPENEIGVVPIAQVKYNIKTPTKNKHTLDQFLTNIDLENKTFPSFVVEWCVKALNFRSQSKKTILYFIGSLVDSESDFDPIFTIFNCLIGTGFSIKVVFFGEGVSYSELFEEKVHGENFTYVVVSPEDDFYQTVFMLMGRNSDMLEDDPELAAAIELSKREQ